ncbi:uncharacterized protein TM35_000102590 [Trypanosoma theileri]|uniref:Tbingi protein n=1 Tax=Trypanosoma theileri TaxID=67003 RepID=A0A1X0NZG9_9TRYP|nr:uncharacterized protein TM35_000102590 [Trypanosoma theileri]ORC89991.1 hypothetical protein TM35_000102590 [Trypanosoma theileri]
MNTHVVQTRQRMNFRLLQLAAISSATWGPKRDALRAFYLALVRAQALYGFEVWYWDAAPKSHKLLDTGQNKACRTIVGIPYGCRSADALREARLLPLEMAAMIRSLKYLMRCQTRGESLKESAEQVYHETHPVREFYVRIMKNLSNTCYRATRAPFTDTNAKVRLTRSLLHIAGKRIR